MNATPRTILLIATLDSKAEEASFVADELTRLGGRCIVMDVGILGESDAAEISPRRVAGAGGGDLDELRLSGSRSYAIEVMGRGARTIVAELTASGEIAGVLGIGGSGGTTLAAEAMQDLPTGFPKGIVSTIAAFDVRALIGSADTVLFPSVVDLAGLNRVSMAVLANAASAILAMASRPAAPESTERPLVAISAIGLTTGLAMTCRRLLEAEGMDAVTFHATGTGGDALEDLVDAGDVVGVLDMTLVEISDALFGGDGPASRGRLRRGSIPRVLAPGGLDMIKFGAPENVPAKFASRLHHSHSATVTLVRTSADDAPPLASELAERLSDSSAPLAFLIPSKGLSAISVPGGPFEDLRADDAIVSAIVAALPSRVAVKYVDSGINDDAFAAAAVRALTDLIQTTTNAGIQQGASA